MTVRKCSTCKHYEPAPIWRKGWCRNPLLYSPQQSHLVGEDDLDCDRGMGNYWEPIDAPPGVAGVTPPPDTEADLTNPNPTSAFEPQVAPLNFVPPPGGGARSGRGGEMHQYPGSGRPGDFDDDDEFQRPSTHDRSRSPFASGSERQFTYYSEERYWTDYLRIAVPVVGVILMLGFVWFLLQSLLGGDDEAGNNTNGNTVPTVVMGATPGGGVGAVSTPRPLPTTETTPAPSSGSIGQGATVVVANTDGAGVNLRSSPSTSGELVMTLEEGTELTITGESVTADGYTWWPVEGDGVEGYVVEDFLELAQ